MRNFILKRLKNYRTKLMESLSESSHEQENILVKVVSLLVWTVLYLWYCIVDCLVIRMEGVLVCALFGEELDDGSSNAAFMRILMGNKEKVEPIVCKEGEESTLLVFYSYKLRKISRLFEDDKEIYKLYVKAVNGIMHTCNVCGCGILGPFPYTYRDSCGCVGKSYECYVCRQYTTKGTENIYNYCKEHGSEDTLIKAVTEGFSQREDECL